MAADTSHNTGVIAIIPSKRLRTATPRSSADPPSNGRAGGNRRPLHLQTRPLVHRLARRGRDKHLSGQAWHLPPSPASRDPKFAATVVDAMSHPTPCPTPPETAVASLGAPERLPTRIGTAVLVLLVHEEYCRRSPNKWSIVVPNCLHFAARARKLLNKNPPAPAEVRGRGSMVHR